MYHSPSTMYHAQPKMNATSTSEMAQKGAHQIVMYRQPSHAMYMRKKAVTRCRRKDVQAFEGARGARVRCTTMYRTGDRCTAKCTGQAARSRCTAKRCKKSLLAARCRRAFATMPALYGVAKRCPRLQKRSTMPAIGRHFSSSRRRRCTAPPLPSAPPSPTPVPRFSEKMYDVYQHGDVQNRSSPTPWPLSPRLDKITFIADSRR